MYDINFINSLKLYNKWDTKVNKIFISCQQDIKEQPGKMTETEQYTEIKLSVPWGHVAAKTYGSSTGQPVLLVHGRLDNAGSFTRLMKYLPKELFYYVCIDLPGHGWSSPLPSWMIIDGVTYTHTLYFILEALQWKTCIYIGHSMGAQLGLLFSIFQPNRIKKLISIDGILTHYKNSERYALKDLTTYLEDAHASSVKVYHNEKSSLSFTKEEILHAFKTMRISFLNSEAANALFERAVTKVNEKYIYNRDIRLKNYPFTLNMEEIHKFNLKLTIPIYFLLATKGMLVPLKETRYKLEFETIQDKAKEIIYVNGNHDIHNNNPEKVAPFICKILNNDNFGKL